MSGVLHHEAERGWDVFDSNRGLEIERDDEADMFADDDEALAAVHAAAARGDIYAITALACVEAQDYARWENFLRQRRS